MSVKNAMALGAGGALVAGAVAIATASPSWAMPVLSNMAAVSTAASNQVTDVHYYRRGYYCHGCSYPYPYPYAYSYPFSFGYGWSWGGW
jgi:hypothetical protein